MIKIISTSLVCLLLVFLSEKSVAGKVLFSPLSLEARYERTEYQNLENKKPNGFLVGYLKNGYNLAFEYSRFSEDSGNEFLGIERTHQDFLFWIKKNFYNYDDLKLSAGAAAGLYKESVMNYIGSNRSIEEGLYESMLGLSVGVNYTFEKVLYLEAELRAFNSQNILPSPQLSAAMRVGILF